MISAWILPLIFTIACCANLVCPLDGCDTKIREAGLTQCVAHCLDVVDPAKMTNASQTPCYYSRSTGKSKGCGTIYRPNSHNNKVVICDAESTVNGMSDETAILCDMIYFDVFNFNTKSDVVSILEEALSSVMENAGRLRKAGVKVIGSLMLWDTAANMMRISASPELREKLAASIMNVMEQLQLDGLFLQWMWPGCPKGFYCKPPNPHREYTVELVTAIGKPLKSSGRLFLLYFSLGPFITFQLGDYFSEIIPYVDYFVLETNNMAGHWNNKPDLNFNLKATKVLVKNFISSVKDPGFRNKLVVTFKIGVCSYELKTPTKDYKIHSVAHNKESKKYSNYLNLPEWCKLVRPESGYKVFINTETQNYAIKKDHFFIFDDVQSLKEKMDWVNSFAIGGHLFNSSADDQNNECGCGLLPFTRTVAQLLKFKDCDPLPCF